MDERLERYAELVVRVGANVQAGQEVFIQTAVEQHDLARPQPREVLALHASHAVGVDAELHDPVLPRVRGRCVHR